MQSVSKYSAIRFVAGALLIIFMVLIWRIASNADSVDQPDFSTLPIEMPDGRQFYAARYEVTAAEWNACFAAGGCAFEIHTNLGNSEELPATGLNFYDALNYAEWISQETGHDYRLPTSEEWLVLAQDEMPKRAGSQFDAPELTWASAYLTKGNAPRALRARGEYGVSKEGIYDLRGSVWEWTMSCFNDADTVDECAAFYTGGEHEAVMSYLTRDPAQGGCAVGSPPAHLGLRLVSDKL